MQHTQIEEYKCSLPIYSVINRAQINVCVQSADDFSERSLRMAEVSRDQRNLEEEVEEDASPLEANKGEEGLFFSILKCSGQKGMFLKR